MADDTGLTSRLLNFVTLAIASCKSLHIFLNDFNTAPDHIRMIVNDLDALHKVLATLEALLTDSELFRGVVLPADAINLEDVLRDCTSVFAEIEGRLKEVQGEQGYYLSFEELKWAFKKENWEELKERLGEHKLILNLVVSVANGHNRDTSSADLLDMKANIATLTREPEVKLLKIMQLQEELKSTRQPKTRSNDKLDLRMVRVDYSFALRNYLDNATPFISSMGNTPPTPSLRASSIRKSSITKSAASTTGSTYVDTIQESCTQLFIKGVPGHKTLVLQVEPEDLISDVKNRIMDRIYLRPRVWFGLSYRGRVLDRNFSLDHHKISSNATLNLTHWLLDGWSDRHVTFTITATKCLHDIPMFYKDTFDYVRARFITLWYIRGIPPERWLSFEGENFDVNGELRDWPQWPKGPIVRAHTPGDPAAASSKKPEADDRWEAESRHPLSPRFSAVHFLFKNAFSRSNGSSTVASTRNARGKERVK